ncbi:hypothetical protein MY8738_006882 [Beauveria namnaoensis]
MGKPSPYKKNPCNTRGLTIRSPRCPAPEGDTRFFQSYLPFPDVGQDEFECLNLVVVRPSTAALAMHSIDAETTQLPVLIWIHGGGFKDVRGNRSKLHWALFTLIVDEWTIRQSDVGCGVSIHLGETSGELRESDDKVQLLISAADDEFKDFALIANEDYAKFRSLLTSSYPSEAAAEEILQTYGISSTLPDEEFTENFSQFVCDSTLVHKVYRGYKFFKAHREQQALLHGQDPKHLGLQYHHYEFGNPFLGPLRGTAHHGVELIYAFGNFHHAMEKADQGILQGYADPDQARVEANVSKLPVDMKSIEYQKSNIELSYEMQDKWIQFVAQDCP